MARIAAEKLIETIVAADAETSVQAKSTPVLNWIVKSAGLAPSYIRMIGTVRTGLRERILQSISKPPVCGSRCALVWMKTCKTGIHS